MTNQKRTQQWGGASAAAAVRTLRVDVIEGSDAGRSLWGEHETLTIGSDEWLIFPARQMGAVPTTGTDAYQFTGATPNHQSNHAGYAYKKIV